VKDEKLSVPRINEHNIIDPLPLIPEPGSPTPKQKIIERRAKAHEWLDLLPKVPSHFCRSSSKKIYVESTFRSVLHMHETYKEWCTNHSCDPVSRKVFQSILDEENVGIHSPRKDQCDTCFSYKLGLVTEEIYDTHISKKTEAQNAKSMPRLLPMTPL
jgi:hypothetical protein